MSNFKVIAMADLKTLINSNVFDKDLNSDNRLKFALQIDPAIHYMLKYLVLRHSRLEEMHYNSSQLLDIVKEKELIKEQLISEIEHILKITKQVKHKMLFKNQEEIDNLLMNANKCLLNLKNIVEEIAATEKVE